MWQLITFLTVLSPLWAWFNVWIIRTIYVPKGGDYYSAQWHFWQGILRALVVTFTVTRWQSLELWWLLLLWWAYDYIVYPGIINLFALRQWEKRGVFYVGRKGREDKHPDFLQVWLLRKDKPELWAAGIKIGFLIVAVLVAWRFGK